MVTESQNIAYYNTYYILTGFIEIGDAYFDASKPGKRDHGAEGKVL
jgi:hypothetical protein